MFLQFITINIRIHKKFSFVVHVQHSSLPILGLVNARTPEAVLTSLMFVVYSISAFASEVPACSHFASFSLHVV